jgi:general secretion pathway protein A
MYTSFFGLKSKPFQLTPDPEFLFPSKVHKRALTYLNYGIVSDAGGFILVTGEVGTGKTTVIRSMVKRLREDVIFSRINNTRLTSEQLIAAINDDFGLDIQGKDKTQMLRDLTDFLIEQYGKGRKSILIIDEAQNLSPDLLEEIRLLSNLETDKSKLLQIILIGQSELRNVLSQPELRALRQRINISCHISPLLKKEIREYIFHRLEIAGNKEAVVFEDGGIDLIYNFSRGIPRLINIACDFLLLSAFIDGIKEISLDMVKEVVSDLEKDNRYWQDEVLGRYSNDAETLKEMTERQENPGKLFSDKNFNYGKEKSIEKISETEKLLKTDKDRFKTKLKNNDAVNMVESLKKKSEERKEMRLESPERFGNVTSEIRKKMKEGVIKKNIKKNLWSKIFSKR